jgi:GntR family transcriptional repressor for pyruvate dehydrogenase complex
LASCPVSKEHAYEQILERLEPLIRAGALRQGTRLASERELACALHVSRNTLREAIRVLITRGLLESRPGHGTFVTESSTDRIALSFAAALVREPPNVLDIMEFRRALEPAVASSAAMRATAGEIATMQAIVEQQASKVRAAESAVEEDAQFHNALAAATRNPVFVRVVDQCLDLIRATRRQALQTKTRGARSLEGHRRILQAIRRHDPEAARDAMQAHLVDVEHLIGTRR